MAKGQQKSAREKKKPKQDAKAKPQSAYQQSKSGSAAPPAFGKKS
jgi:hypothetical protein